MSRKLIMLLKKRMVLGIAFAVVMAGPNMTRAAALIMKPLQGVSFDIGTKRAVSYFLSDGNTCKLTLMLVEVARDDEVNGPTAARMTIAVEVGKTTHLDTAEGKSIEFQCQARAQAMSIEVLNRAASAERRPE
jgi:hypothetical protein